MRKCALHNLGCKVNSYETQAMQQMMEDAGYEIVQFGADIADVYIINTCSVTNIADRKSRQMIHKARKLNPQAVVVAAGCYVESSAEDLDEDIDIAIGNNDKSKLLEMLEHYFGQMDLEEKEKISEVVTYDEMNIFRPAEHTRAYVKIQDGCNRFCSYCIIPYVRGRIRSRDLEDILSEISRLAESGCKEVVLTGIHLSSYGMDKQDQKLRLIDVIGAINAQPGIERIRLGSLEPMIVTDEFVALLKTYEKVCPHFHLSLQSGCDETLKRMNRRYTVDEFYQGVETLRKYYEEPAITTDVIVGFPGETEEEFAQTRGYLEKVRFYEMHIFKYSRRKGTVADQLTNQIPDTKKTLRSDILLALDEKLSKEYRESYLGKSVKVLLEEQIELDGKAYMMGFTETYVKVAVEVMPGEKWASNDILNVKIMQLSEKDMVIGVAES